MLEKSFVQTTPRVQTIFQEIDTLETRDFAYSSIMELRATLAKRVTWCGIPPDCKSAHSEGPTMRSLKDVVFWLTNKIKNSNS